MSEQPSNVKIDNRLQEIWRLENRVFQVGEQQKSEQMQATKPIKAHSVTRVESDDITMACQKGSESSLHKSLCDGVW